MMRKHFFLLFLILLPMVSIGQALKKKYLGIYTGAIPAFVLSAGTSTIQVDAASISIALMEDKTCTQSIGNDQRKGTWKLIAQSKTSYTLELTLENQIMIERCVLDKKSKQLLREGFYPQPDALLTKQP
jgi:hypothetical protein